MKNKLIAAIISICVIGVAGTAIFLDLKSNDSKVVTENKVIQEKIYQIIV